MNFSANEYSHNTTGGSSKILQPGEHYCRIHDLTLVSPPWNDEAYFLCLKLEGPHMGDGFDGIAVDRDNPALGTYDGQIATVNSYRYPFSTYEYQGKEIDRDQQIFNWVNALATQMGVMNDVQKSKIQAETIEEYVTAIKPFLCNPELWGTFTVAGREYYKDGYDKPNYNLFFPKKSGKLFPYTVKENAEGEPVENLLRYNEKEHILLAEAPATPTEVDGFGTNNSAPTLDLG